MVQYTPYGPNAATHNLVLSSKCCGGFPRTSVNRLGNVHRTFVHTKLLVFFQVTCMRCFLVCVATAPHELNCTFILFHRTRCERKCYRLTLYFFVLHKVLTRGTNLKKGVSCFQSWIDRIDFFLFHYCLSIPLCVFKRMFFFSSAITIISNLERVFTYCKA